MTPKQVANLGSELGKLSATLGKTEKEMTNLLMSGQNMSRGVENALKKSQANLLKESNSLAKAIEANQKKVLQGGIDAGKANKALKIQQEQKKATDAQLDAVSGLLGPTKGLAGAAEAVSAAMAGATAASVAMSAVLGIAGLAIAALVKLWNTWYELEKKTVESTGKLNRALGITGEQSRVAAAGAEELYKTFSDLEGSVDGIEESFQFMTELNLATKSTAQSAKQTKENYLALSRGLNLSVEQLAKMKATSATSFDMDFEAMGADIIKFSKDAAIPGSIIAKDMADNQDNMARFGKTGVKVFKDVSLFAKALNMDVGKIFDGMRKFDFFDQGTEAINQLNSMFGTAISSYELLMTQNPAERLDKIRQGIMDQGKAWKDMTQYEHTAAAQALGMSEAEAGRLLQVGMSLKKFQADQADAAAKREKSEEAGMDNQTRLNEMLKSSSIIFNSFSRILDKIWVNVASKLGPIFKTVFKTGQDGLQGFADMIDKVVSDPKFTAFVTSIAEGIKGLVEGFKDFDFGKTWETVKTKIDEWVKTLETLGATLNRIADIANKIPILNGKGVGESLLESITPKSVLAAAGLATGGLGGAISASAFAQNELPSAASYENSQASYRGVRQSDASNPASRAIDKTRYAQMNEAQRSKALEANVNVVTHTTLNADGKVLETVVTKHQSVAHLT